jgi:hypothetical protein
MSNAATWIVARYRAGAGLILAQSRVLTAASSRATPRPVEVSDISQQPAHTIPALRAVIAAGSKPTPENGTPSQKLPNENKIARKKK